jgi:hypothetical protein
VQARRLHFVRPAAVPGLLEKDAFVRGWAEAPSASGVEYVCLSFDCLCSCGLERLTAGAI